MENIVKDTNIEYNSSDTSDDDNIQKPKISKTDKLIRKALKMD